MIKFIAVAFALVVATSAQAMAPVPLHQAEGVIKNLVADGVTDPLRLRNLTVENLLLPRQ